MKGNETQKILIKATKDIEVIFNSIADEISTAIYRYGITQKEPFWKYNRNLYKELNRLLKSLKSRNLAVINDSMKSAWQLSNKQIDKMLSDYLKRKNTQKLFDNPEFKNTSKARLIGVDVPSTWVYYNEPAMNAMINRSANGFTPSGRVWNISLKSRQLIEQTLKSGILDGTSSGEMSRILRQTLKNPNALFRRVRNKKTGILELSNPAKNYHPGRGVYRSAYKNALRLCGTETNMAYRFAEFERYQQIPFIIGYEVNLSAAHPRPDICDSMKGKYPKTFAFIGWHPHCLCYSTSIMLNDDQFKKYLDTGTIKHTNYIKEIPKDAKDYIKENAPKIDKMEDKPYWLRQNADMINEQTNLEF
jgi:hypothetical protein